MYNNIACFSPNFSPDLFILIAPNFIGSIVTRLLFSQRVYRGQTNLPPPFLVPPKREGALTYPCHLDTDFVLRHMWEGVPTHQTAIGREWRVTHTRVHI